MTKNTHSCATEIVLLQSICLIATLAACNPANAEDAKDDAKWEGAWVIESATDDGKESVFAGVELTFKGGKLELKTPDGEKGIGSYTLDSKTDPKSVDLGIKISDFLVKRPGVYEFKGEHLVICQPSDNAGPRPKSIDGSAGSKCWLWKLKKKK